MAAAWLALGIVGACTDPKQPPPAPHATAADYRASRIAAALDAAEALLKTRGFGREGPEWRGFLVEQAPTTHPISLSHGSCYVGIAAGSGAIRNLGLQLFDADGAEVATGPLPGPTNAMHLCPPQSGTYYLVARAAVGNGLFAARWFSGPSGLDIRVDDLFRTPSERPAEAPSPP